MVITRYINQFINETHKRQMKPNPKIAFAQDVTQKTNKLEITCRPIPNKENEKQICYETNVDIY